MGGGFGSGGLGGGIAGIVGKLAKTEKGREINDKVWKTIEGVAADVSPTLGDAVKDVGKVGKTVENFFDSPLGKLVSNTPSTGLPVSPLMFLQTDQVVDESVLSSGDHIWVDCFAFSHHGIYVGGLRVIHYGNNDGGDGPTVCEVSLSSFAEGKPVRRRNSPAKWSRITIVGRARMRLIEDDYNLVFNNCEHFAEWCRNGD
jgi:hypothetical protein